jgi:hypothetical protein
MRKNRAGVPASVLLKRLAYSAAVIPRTRKKVRRIASADLNPQKSATSLSPDEELSIICFAASTHSCLAEADLRKVARTHSQAICKRFHCEVFAEILQHPHLELTQRLRDRRLVREHMAKLGLSTRSHEKHHGQACDGQCCFVPVILFNWRQMAPRRAVTSFDAEIAATDSKARRRSQLTRFDACPSP